MRILKSHPLVSLLNGYLVDSPQPSNLSYAWNFGSLLGFCLVIQIVTGVTLAMHYNPSVLEAFNSVEHIMRDVNNGWLIRYLQSNTASSFFFLVYLHVERGLYRGRRGLVWTIGTVILIPFVVPAFFESSDTFQGFFINFIFVLYITLLVLPFVLAGLVIMHLKISISDLFKFFIACICVLAVSYEVYLLVDDLIYWVPGSCPCPKKAVDAAFFAMSPYENISRSHILQALNIFTSVSHDTSRIGYFGQYSNPVFLRNLTPYELHICTPAIEFLKWKLNFTNEGINNAWFVDARQFGDPKISGWFIDVLRYELAARPKL